jgi:glycosyltransferase involved in cell wall biosynthesis
MRVVITHTDLRLYWPARIAALQEALTRRGDQLFIVEIAGKGSPYSFCGNEPTGSIRNWIRLFPDARMEDLSPVQASQALVGALNNLYPDVVLAGGIAYPSGAAAVYWAKSRQKSVIIFDDVRPSDVPRGRLVEWIKRMIYGQVDAVLCPAEPWVEGLMGWGFRREQIFFGVDTVDNDFWNNNSVSEGMEVLPGGAQWPSSFFLAVGRQIGVKNFSFLLQVYEKYRLVVGADRALPLVFVGEGPERSALEGFVRMRRLKHVHFFPFVSAARLRVFYQRAAALVLPSTSETWGLVVNEAMAAGLPVLVSDACGCSPVLLKEGMNGYGFSPEKPDELLDALLGFTLQSVGERAAMGEESHRLIQPWGLGRFVRGCLQAVDFSMVNRKTCRSAPVWFLLKNWKGRYRPV